MKYSISEFPISITKLFILYSTYIIELYLGQCPKVDLICYDLG